jgi:hypothetical protein
MEHSHWSNIYNVYGCYHTHTAHSLCSFIVWQLVLTLSMGHYQAIIQERECTQKRRTLSYVICLGPSTLDAKSGYVQHCTAVSHIALLMTVRAFKCIWYTFLCCCWFVPSNGSVFVAVCRDVLPLVLYLFSTIRLVLHLHNTFIPVLSFQIVPVN